ncbi:T9SS type A sorting domain-containing protein [uncultured Kordia sp.]|uniref:T9SS type A sorting domain-containing protein n=1 Tax=uncultured Kordia sp. TaxID=507699 RepID=UPI0026382DD0|nr:T9SS type A sorting domain-containing protein [uncultured Kordia sp.]
MKKTLLTLTVLLTSFGLLGQVQLGTNLLNENTGDGAGRSIDISDNGRVVVVGAPAAVSAINAGIFIRGGHVRTHGYNGVHWTAGADFDAEEGGDNFGNAVTMNDDASLIACGAPSGRTAGVGYVHVYLAQGDPNTPGGYIRYDGNELEGETGTSGFGRSLDMNGDGSRLIVAGNNYVKVFEKTSLGDPWLQIGQTLQGESGSDNFGIDVAISSNGNRIVVGNSLSDIGTTNAGYARVYDLVGNTWTPIGGDITDGFGDNAGAGVDIASNGSRIAVSFPGDDGNGLNAGVVRTYFLNGGVWTQIGNDMQGSGNGDGFGSSGNAGSIDMSQSGQFIAIGSQSGVGNLTGYVKVYQMPTTTGTTTWSQIGTTIFGTASGDRFGYSVAINDDMSFDTRVAMGAPEAGNSGTSGNSRVYEYNSVVLSIDDIANTSNTLTLYPNPTNDILYIKGTTPKKVTVFDAQGRLVKEYLNPTDHISFGTLQRGMYLLQIIDHTNALSNAKIIVQ